MLECTHLELLHHLLPGRPENNVIHGHNATERRKIWALGDIEEERFITAKLVEYKSSNLVLEYLLEELNAHIIEVLVHVLKLRDLVQQLHIKKAHGDNVAGNRV